MLAPRERSTSSAPITKSGCYKISTPSSFHRGWVAPALTCSTQCTCWATRASTCPWCMVCYRTNTQQLVAVEQLLQLLSNQQLQLVALAPRLRTSQQLMAPAVPPQMRAAPLHTQTTACGGEVDLPTLEHRVSLYRLRTERCGLSRHNDVLQRLKLQQPDPAPLAARPAANSFSSVSWVWNKVGSTSAAATKQ